MGFLLAQSIYFFRRAYTFRLFSFMGLLLAQSIYFFRRVYIFKLFSFMGLLLAQSRSIYNFRSFSFMGFLLAQSIYFVRSVFKPSLGFLLAQSIYFVRSVFKPSLGFLLAQSIYFVRSVFKPSLGFLLALAFFVLPLKATANICLHPLEQAALLHGKPKKKLLKDRIKATNKRLKKIEKEIENKEGAIDDAKVALSNSLKDKGDNFVPGNLEVNNKKGTSAAAEVIHDYMAEKKNELEQEIKQKWDPSDSLKSKGGVNKREFCKKYAIDKRQCETAIERLKQRLERLAELREFEDKLQELIDELEDEEEFGDGEDEDETEASGLCFECLDELRELDRPSTGQVVGNILSIAAGGAMSYFGYQAGKSAGQRTNVLRLRGGYDPVSHQGLSWAGASLGLPFISNGIYGLSGGNSRFGSFACGPGHSRGHGMYNPFAYGAMGGGAGFHFGAGGNPFNSMAGAGAQFHFGGNPFFNSMAGAGAQFHFGGNPFNPMAGAGAQFHFGGNPFNPMAGAGAQFHFGGNPFNPMAGAGAQFHFGGNPFNPMANAGFQFGLGNQSFNPAFNPGMSRMNMAMQYRQQQYTQYMQFRQQQMQARIKMQQAWLQHQIAVQKDWTNRQQVIGSLNQEIYKIKQQIQMVASGGGLNSSSLTSGASFSAGVNLGNNLTTTSGPPGTPGGPPPSGRTSDGAIEGR